MEITSLDHIYLENTMTLVFRTEIGNNDSCSSFWYFLGGNIGIIKLVPTWENQGNLIDILLVIPSCARFGMFMGFPGCRYFLGIM